MRKLFLNLLHDILRDQNIMHPRADLYTKFFYLFKNFGGDKI